jgi:hypothetical protein
MATCRERGESLVRESLERDGIAVREGEGEKGGERYI